MHDAMKTHLVGSAGWRQIVFSFNTLTLSGLSSFPVPGNYSHLEQWFSDFRARPQNPEGAC